MFFCTSTGAKVLLVRFLATTCSRVSRVVMTLTTTVSLLLGWSVLCVWAVLQIPMLLLLLRAALSRADAAAAAAIAITMVCVMWVIDVVRDLDFSATGLDGIWPAHSRSPRPGRSCSSLQVPQTLVVVTGCLQESESNLYAPLHVTVNTGAALLQSMSKHCFAELLCSLG